MESNGSIKKEVDMDGDQSWTDNMDREQRRSRSRSPLDKDNESRDSSLTRTSRQVRNNRSPSPPGKRTRAPANRRVYVANIPYECKGTTVKDLFMEKVGDVSYVEFFENEHGKFGGCGIVKFKEASSIQKAVEALHRYEIRGRKLVVKEDYDVDRDKTGKPIVRNRMGGDRDHDDNGGSVKTIGNVGSTLTPQYDTYGLSPEYLKSHGITGPLSCRLFFANLNYKATPQMLAKEFKRVGKVVKVELKKDVEGKSKGYGTIEMGHPLEAVQAIDIFNNKKCFGRTLTVRMDKYGDESDEHLPEYLQQQLVLQDDYYNVSVHLLQDKRQFLICFMCHQCVVCYDKLSGTLDCETCHQKRNGANTVVSVTGLGYNDSDQSYNRCDSFLKTLKSDMVIIRNLPTPYNWQILKDYFRGIENIIYTIPNDNGAIVIRFATETDAQRAIGKCH